MNIYEFFNRFSMNEWMNVKSINNQISYWWMDEWMLKQWSNQLIMSKWIYKKSIVDEW